MVLWLYWYQLHWGCRYADDIARIAPSVMSLKTILHICDGLVALMMSNSMSLCTSLFIMVTIGMNSIVLRGATVAEWEHTHLPPLRLGFGSWHDLKWESW